MKRPPRSAKELSIKTMPVTIRVIRMGGHKMTISVFRQIPTITGWDLTPSGNVVLRDIPVIGYVLDNGVTVLFDDGGELKKARAFEDQGLLIVDVLSGKYPAQVELSALVEYLKGAGHQQLYIAT